MEEELIRVRRDGQCYAERRQSGLCLPRGQRFRAALHLPGAPRCQGPLLEPDALVPGAVADAFTI